MADCKVFPLYVGFGMKAMVFGMLGLFTFLGVYMLAVPGSVEGGEEILGVVPFAVFWLAMIGVFWYMALSLPHRIEMTPSGEITFVGALRTRKVDALEIDSVTPVRSQFGFLRLKHSNGSILLLNQFDGFHEFLTDLRRLNPNVLLRGC